MRSQFKRSLQLLKILFALVVVKRNTLFRFPNIFRIYWINTIRRYVYTDMVLS